MDNIVRKKVDIFLRECSLDFIFKKIKSKVIIHINEYKVYLKYRKTIHFNNNLIIINCFLYADFDIKMYHIL
jgi:hypothetical protein